MGVGGGGMDLGRKWDLTQDWGGFSPYNDYMALGLDQAAHKARVVVHTSADQIQTRSHPASVLCVLQEEII